MMSHDRRQLRHVLCEAWRKQSENLALSPLEMQIVTVLHAHPEYHDLLNEDVLDRDFLPDMGQINPFLHLSLHLGLLEQLATNRPTGIRDVYHSLLIKHSDKHAVEHRMMEVLAEILWEAQREQRAPNEKEYVRKLQALI